jgi:hypothetical protein
MRTDLDKVTSLFAAKSAVVRVTKAQALNESLRSRLTRRLG